MAGERSPTPTKIGETSDHVMDFIGLQAQFSQIIKTSQKNRSSAFRLGLICILHDAFVTFVSSDNARSGIFLYVPFICAVRDAMGRTVA